MHMREQFVPDNREDSDNELHRKIRKEIQEPTGWWYSFYEEIANLKKFNSKKAPGDNGLTLSSPMMPCSTMHFICP